MVEPVAPGISGAKAAADLSRGFVLSGSSNRPRGCRADGSPDGPGKAARQHEIRAQNLLGASDRPR